MKTKLFFCLALLFCSISNAQYAVIHNFNGTLGNGPYGSLTLSKEKLFGMTYKGGSHDSGCIFSVDTNGNNYKDLFDFNDSSGAHPSGTLTIINNNLYGIAEVGGSYGYGSIFSIDTNGTGYVKLHSFNGNDNGYPYGSLTLLGNKIYGLAQFAIFNININGSGYIQQVYVLNSAGGTLAQGENKFYGMNISEGPYGDIFSIDTNGNGYDSLYHFNNTYGSLPEGSITYAGKMLYGMTSSGGANNKGCIFSIDTNGSRYRDIFDFNGANGANPYGDLMFNHGILYGMSTSGGAHGVGCIFSIDTSGLGYRDLFDFNGTGGANPYGDLILNGNVFYGMTENGGSSNDGVIFSFKDTIGDLGVNAVVSQSYAIKLFPNPSNGKFTISMKGFTSNAQIEIYNMLGQSIYQAKLNAGNTEINLRGCQDGVYLYRVIDNDGNEIGTGKLIFQ